MRTFLISLMFLSLPALAMNDENMPLPVDQDVLELLDIYIKNVDESTSKLEKAAESAFEGLIFLPRWGSKAALRLMADSINNSGGNESAKFGAAMLTTVFSFCFTAILTLPVDAVLGAIGFGVGLVKGKIEETELDSKKRELKKALSKNLLAWIKVVKNERFAVREKLPEEPSVKEALIEYVSSKDYDGDEKFGLFQNEALEIIEKVDDNFNSYENFFPELVKTVRSINFGDQDDQLNPKIAKNIKKYLAERANSNIDAQDINEYIDIALFLFCSLNNNGKKIIEGYNGLII